jgi:beta-phosphoglucomutase
MQHNRGVIWDMDGVIADTAQAHFLSWQHVFKKEGIDFTHEDFQHMFGQRNDTIISTVLKRDVSQEKIDKIASAKEIFFRNASSRDIKAFPGVIDLFKLLENQGISSAVASSAPVDNINMIMQALDIGQYIKAVASGREVKEGKPSPQIFLLAAEKLGIIPSSCIVIEDAVAGVQGAKRAGMGCIGVTNTHPAESLSEADLVVNSLNEVGIEQLNNLFNATR